MDNDAKLRPFILAKILYERTDYDHSLTTAQLVKILEDEYNMPTHRTTVGYDIEMLKSLGMDIQCVKSTQNKYNVLDRYFLDSELRLMIDAVASARFIPASQSKKLIEKISKLAGLNAAERMTRNVSVERRIKGSNKKIMGIIDAINEAITQKKQITFQYFEYNVKKELKPRFDGYWYKFSPWRLVWNGDYYYIVGWYEKYKKVMNYRVDRIVSNPKILEEDTIPMPKEFDLDKYINTMYHMFSSERRTVDNAKFNWLKWPPLETEKCSMPEEVSYWYSGDMIQYGVIIHKNMSKSFICNRFNCLGLLEFALESVLFPGEFTWYDISSCFCDHDWFWYSCNIESGLTRIDELPEWCRAVWNICLEESIIFKYECDGEYYCLEDYNNVSSIKLRAFYEQIIPILLNEIKTQENESEEADEYMQKMRFVQEKIESLYQS